jgi:hypothetical protein
MNTIFFPFADLEAIGAKEEPFGDWKSARAIMQEYLLNFARYPDIDKEESCNPKGITFKIKDDALAIQFKLRFQI